MLVIGSRETRAQHSVSPPIKNQMALRSNGAGYAIIAVGGPESWAAPGPLPPEAKVEDLIQASVTDPDHASNLWHPFLYYVDACARSDIKARLARIFCGIKVRIDIEEQSHKSAVKAAIERGNKRKQGFRIRMVEG